MNDKYRDMDALMVQFFQENAIEDEKMRFLSWLNDHSENETSFFQMKEIIDSRNRTSVSGRQEIRQYKAKKRILPSERIRLLFSVTWIRYGWTLTDFFENSKHFIIFATYFKTNISWNVQCFSQHILFAKPWKYGLWYDFCRERERERERERD